MLEALGIVMIVVLIIALTAWIVWVTMAGAMAWGNDTDIIFLKMDSRQSKAWSEIVDKRLNVIEKKLKIKKEKENGQSTTKSNRRARQARNI